MSAILNEIWVEPMKNTSTKDPSAESQASQKDQPNHVKRSPFTLFGLPLSDLQSERCPMNSEKDDR